MDHQRQSHLPAVTHPEFASASCFWRSACYLTLLPGFACSPTKVAGFGPAVLCPLGDRVLLNGAAVPLQECEASEVCAGISGPIIQAAGLPSGVNVGDVGICQTPPSGGLQLPEYSIVPPAR